MNRFEGKSVIVTGAATGFGEAIAKSFAAEGASVVLADMNREGAEKVAAELPKAIVFEIDVSSEEQNEAMAAATMDAFDRIDVVCTNAGTPHRAGRMIDISTEDFDRMFAINTRSVFLAAKYCVPHMKPGSSIISTASIGAICPRPYVTPYNASKGAVVTLTKGLAGELAPDIRVNAVLPVSAPTGFDQNALGHELTEEQHQSVIQGIPMGRRATSQDVADAYIFLASEQAGFLTGVCLEVDGGRSIG